MIAQYLSEGFVLGLSLSATCIGTCGPIYFAYLIQKKANWVQSIVIILKISGARFFSYALFGLFAGFIGRAIGDFNRSWFTTLAYFFCSILLIFTAFRTHRSEKGCAMAKWHKYIDNPFLLGLVTGLNFCPAFLIAVTRAVDVSGPISGALVFIAFFFGSNLPLFFFAVFGVMGNVTVFRKIGMVAAVIVGAFFLGKAGMTAYNLLTKKEVAQEQIDEKDLITILDNTPSYILTADTSAYQLFIKVLAKGRKGTVQFITDEKQFPEDGYLFVDDTWADEDSTFEQLKKPGVFVIVLPGSEVEGWRDESYSTTIVSFLARYHFKLDREHGSLFYLNRFLSHGKKP